MDTATARKRLEGIRHDLERSMTVLRGENHRDGAVSESPADPADAGANLSEADRSQAVLEAAGIGPDEAVFRAAIGAIEPALALQG